MPTKIPVDYQCDYGSCHRRGGVFRVEIFYDSADHEFATLEIRPMCDMHASKLNGNNVMLVDELVESSK